MNSLRSWNFFETPNTVGVYCNTGGFGIDGILSSAIGAAIGSQDKLVFCVIGDLAFFYDMNSLGNRHLPKNLRILLINNGVGTEFRNYNHLGAQFGEDADTYIAAAGHYGSKSKTLVKNYAESLGIVYITAENKTQYIEKVESFLNPEINGNPVIFEVFTNWHDESTALEKMNKLLVPSESKIKKELKGFVKATVGEEGIKSIKRVFQR